MNFVDTGCEIDAFGKGCSYQCSGHCLDNVPCNSTTRYCDSGCDSGYLGPFCNKSMNDIDFFFSFKPLHWIKSPNLRLKNQSFKEI